MRPLIIDDSIRERISQCIAYSKEHVYSVADLMIRDAGAVAAPGSNLNHVVEIPVGYRCVFSVEQQRKLVRHLSVAVDRPGKLPSVPAVEMIMKEFGFVGRINEQLNVLIEYVEDNIPYAINVWGLYE